jgi:hypothetical protein
MQWENKFLLASMAATMDSVTEQFMRNVEISEQMRRRFVAVSLELCKMHGQLFADAFLIDILGSRGAVTSVVEHPLDQGK